MNQYGEISCRPYSGWEPAVPIVDFIGLERYKYGTINNLGVFLGFQDERREATEQECDNVLRQKTS